MHFLAWFVHAGNQSLTVTARNGEVMRELRFSDLSLARKVFVRQCQRIGFGTIEGLEVCDSEPMFGPQTKILIQVKLECDEVPRPEQNLSDYVVSAEIRRLFSQLDAIRNGSIEHVKIQAGLPRVIVLRVSAKS